MGIQLYAYNVYYVKSEICQSKWGKRSRLPLQACFGPTSTEIADTLSLRYCFPLVESSVMAKVRPSPCLVVMVIVQNAFGPGTITMKNDAMDSHHSFNVRRRGYLLGDSAP